MLPSLAILLLRILSVGFLTNALAMLPGLFTANYTSGFSYSEQQTNYYLTQILYEAVYLGIGMGLWFAAPKLADNVTAGREIDQSWNFSGTDLKHTGFVLLGLYIIANSLPYIVRLLPGLLYVIRKNAGAPVEGHIQVFDAFADTAGDAGIDGRGAIDLCLGEIPP